MGNITEHNAIQLTIELTFIANYGANNTATSKLI